MPTGSRNGSALVRLARAARPERVPAGHGLWPDESRPADLVIVLDGALDAPPRWQRDQTPESAVYGLLEALGSMPPERPVVAVHECVTLVVRHAEIHESIEDDDRTCLELIRLVALEHWRGFWEAHPRPRAGPDASAPLRALPN